MRTKILATVALVLAPGLITRAHASEATAYEEILSRYEAIRLSMLNDEMRDVAMHARAIEDRVAALRAMFDAHDAGVPPEKAAECQALLPELGDSAEQLAEAEDLSKAREALFDLSKPLGRYRKLAGTEGSIVAYCPMAKKAWVQPHGEIGNPYMGLEMPTCGNRIAD